MNTSLNASATGRTASTSPQNMCCRAPIRAVKPPRALKASTAAFLELVIPIIKSLNTLLTPVQSSVASLKLPKISSQVSTHPDPSCSFMVPINCVNVLTLVAESTAIAACFLNISTVASSKPIAAISASVISPVII